MGDDTFGSVGEDGLVASVLARYLAPGSRPVAAVLVGPGDDAAVLDPGGPVVVSTDTLVEGFDFRREWSSAHDVGVKTAAQNFADVAAMGARPVALVVSLAAPAGLAADWARGLADGLAQECDRAGATVVGGDVSGAAEIVVTGTAIGVLETGRSAVLRSGARAGDVVALAGTTGPSAAGLDLLLAGRRVEGLPGPLAALVTAHLTPHPPYPAGPVAAAAGATALIDTSDGLLRDAGRVAAASGVVLDLDPDALAPDAALLAAARLVVDEPDAAHAALRRATSWVLAGGEDHALLGCFPPDAALPPPFRRVGVVRAVPDGDEAAALVGGRPWTGPTGWHHFTPPPG